MTNMTTIVMERLDSLGEPTSFIDALSRTLALVVIAPDQNRALRAIAVAERIASTMTEDEVDQATDLAEFILSDLDELVG